MNDLGVPMMRGWGRGLEFRATAANCLIGFGLATLTACAASLPAGIGAGRAATPYGSLALSGPTLGKQTLLPTACASGERELFLGFDLRDEKSDVVTRLVVDPATGPMVRVFANSAPFDRTILFQRANCRVLHFSLDSTGWRVNRVQQLDVSLDIDCQLLSGDAIVGKASAPSCL